MSSLPLSWFLGDGWIRMVTIEASSCYDKEIGAWMEIPSTIVTQEQVMSKSGITVENLQDVADASYTDTSWMPTCDWMVELLGH